MLSFRSGDVPRPTYVEAETAACAAKKNAMEDLVSETAVSTVQARLTAQAQAYQYPDL